MLGSVVAIVLVVVIAVIGGYLAASNDQPSDPIPVATKTDAANPPSPGSPDNADPKGAATDVARTPEQYCAEVLGITDADACMNALEGDQSTDDR